MGAKLAPERFSADRSCVPKPLNVFKNRKYFVDCFENLYSFIFLTFVGCFESSFILDFPFRILFFTVEIPISFEVSKEVPIFFEIPREVFVILDFAFLKVQLKYPFSHS